MNVINRISKYLCEQNDFSEGEIVDYENEVWTISHKEDGMIEIVSKDENKRLRVYPSEIKKITKK